MKKRTIVVSFLAVFALIGIVSTLLAVAGSTRITPYGIQFPDSTYQLTGWEPCLAGGIFYNGGKVGIGTSEPEAQLHVVGDSANVVTIDKGPVGMVFQAYEDYFHIIGYGSGGYNNLALRANAGPTGIYIKSWPAFVGIGTKSPEATLDVNGDLIVRGNISFPRPAYNSGWVNIAQWETLKIVHNLGGDSSDYVVDLTFRSSSDGIHNIGYGGDVDDDDRSGASWSNLNPEHILVGRQRDDTKCNQVRVRIWTH